MRKQQPEFIVVGLIEKPHGVQGEVKVRPLTDYPQRFKQLNSVLIEPRQGEIKEIEISKVSIRGNFVYLTFKGIDTREKAKALQDTYINIKRENILPLEKGRFYHFEVIGFAVKTTAGKNVGYVEGVMDLPANAVFVVKNKRQEFLIPVIKDVVQVIDKEAREIIIHPLAGLLD
ncbi:MAG: ribosome maturation factor RimM [bacterium]